MGRGCGKGQRGRTERLVDMGLLVFDVIVVGEWFCIISWGCANPFLTSDFSLEEESKAG